MKPTYAIAALAAVAITTLGGTAALAAHPSHPAQSCHRPAITLTPVSGKPARVVPGQARAVNAKPTVIRACTTNA